VLVMKGQCDNQKWGYTKEYLDLFPRGDLKIIPGAGHAIEVEQPGLYIRSIVDFLTARE
jgi:proline iminopeptidase